MIRSPHTSGASLRAFMNAASVDCPVLALVETPDVALAVELAREQPPALELGNELELKPFELTPGQYGEWIARAVHALLDAEYHGTVVMGGVYALTNETKAAIRWGLMACTDHGLRCVIGIHLYDASDADVQWLRNLDWPIWVTEVGYPTRCDPARMQQQHDYLAAQIARFSTVPKLERVFLYQRADGLPGDCSDLGTFGIANKPAQLLLHP